MRGGSIIIWHLEGILLATINPCGIPFCQESDSTVQLRLVLGVK